MSRFVPEEYRPDGGVNLAGLPVLIAALFLTAAGLGWLASFIGQWFYLIFLFPVAIGIGLIGVGLVVGHLTKMRSPAMAVLLGLASSALAILTMHYFNYQRFIPVREAALLVAPFLENMPVPTKDPEEAKAFEILKQVKDVDSFPRYLDYEATQGVTISRRGRGGFNLGYVGTWIYWAVEWLVVAAMATFGLVGGATAPFCSACNEWKEERPLGTLDDFGGAVTDVLRDGEIDKLKEHKPASAGGRLILTAAVCPKCQAESSIAVKLEELTTNEKGEEKKTELVHLSYPGEALAHFESVFVEPDEPAEAAEET